MSHLAAKIPTPGSVPDTKVSKDVNQTKESSALEAIALQSQNEVPKESSHGLDESDLKELEEARKVPYDRFKEVNEKAKNLHRQLEEQKSRYESDLRKERETAEVLAAAKYKPKEEDVYLTSETSSDRQVAELTNKLKGLEARFEKLNSQTSQSSLQSQIEKLEKAYPEADSMAVLGWKKVQPDADLEDLMSLSHQKEISKMEKKLQSLIEKKKERSKQAVPTQSGLISLKEGEKPKSMRDAHKMVKALSDKLFN